MNRKLIPVVGLVIGLLALFSVVNHKSIHSLNVPNEVSANWCSGGSSCQQPGNTACNQTTWQFTNYQPAGLTASVASSALGTNCTKHVLNFITAALTDSNEYCMQGVYVEDGSTQIWQNWLDVYTTSTVRTYSQEFSVSSFLHNNTDGTQTLVIVGNGLHTTGTMNVTFGGNCTHSAETISIIGHDE